MKTIVGMYLNQYKIYRKNETFSAMCTKNLRNIVLLTCLTGFSAICYHKINSDSGSKCSFFVSHKREEHFILMTSFARDQRGPGASEALPGRISSVPGITKKTQ